MGEIPPVANTSPLVDAAPVGAVRLNAAGDAAATAAPVAVPDGAINDSEERTPSAVAVPVADPVAADSESDGRVPLADADPEAADSMGNAPISACEPSKKKRLYELYMSSHDYTQLDSDYWCSTGCYKGGQRRKARSLLDLGYSAARQKHLPCRRTINTFGTSPTQHHNRLEQ